MILQETWIREMGQKKKLPSSVEARLRGINKSFFVQLYNNLKRMNKLKIVCVIISWSIAAVTFAQGKENGKSSGYLQQSWKNVATQMPDEWYASSEAKAVAENVLFCQQEIGGWAKNKPYHHPLAKKDSIEIIRSKAAVGATFDNGATVTEMKFLAKMYAKHKDERYRQGFEKGLKYIHEAQYSNGGWPQFYPFRKGKSVEYASHITYNDNAMVNVMILLRDVYESNSPVSALQLSSDLKEKSRIAFNKGVDCILHTQIKINGQPTVWCAQHDELTLAPANARAYELASFSGAESAGITLLLMDIKAPSSQIIHAVKSAVKWFDANKIEGIKVVRVKGNDGKDNTVVVEDKSAPPIWARFYDLESRKPFFCDRDGVKKYSLSEIGSERRNGYSWYTYSPAEVMKRFTSWNKMIASGSVMP
jgi:PelA/Pel-15E family pectate lyase